MKRGKKTWIWGSGSIALLAILTWAFWTEYGSGYSEEQRKRWNGMLASYEKYDDIREWGNSDVLSDWRSSDLNKEAPKWNLDIPKSFGDLPLRGKTIPLLKKLAEEGNGDASLELAFRAEYNNTSDDNPYFSFSSLDSVYLLEMYLPMAEKQGRPGADFLCRLFEYRKKGGDDEGVKNLEGYQGFLSRMDEGDFALGKVYLYLDPNGDEALSRLAERLRKKADCGDVAALGDLGYLEMLKHSRVSHESLALELGYRQGKGAKWVTSKIREFRHMIQERTPSSSPYLEKTEEAIDDWLKGFEWKRSLRKMEVPLEILREAADKGDLHAQYLWIQYGKTIKLYFSKSDWERHLKYTDDLIRVGGMYSHDIFSCLMDSQCPEALFYQHDSFRRIQRDSHVRLQKEYSFIFPDAADLEILEMNVKGSAGMGDFARSMYEYNFSCENKQEAIQLIKNEAEKSNPYAMFYLSKILFDYGEKEGDGLCAWQFLEKFKKWKENVHGRVENKRIWYSEREENSSTTWTLSIEKSVSFQEVNIISRYGDMPGMTVQEAITQFLEDSAMGRYVGKQEETLKAQFEKSGFKIPEDKK